MTLRRRIRIVRRQVAKSLRPSRLVGSLVLLVAMGVAVWLLILVVSENTVSSSAPSNTPSTVAPKATTPTTAPSRTGPKTTVPPRRPKAKPIGETVPLGVYAGPGSPVAATAFSADAGAPVPFAFDYIDGSSWQSIANPLWFIQRWSGTGFRMIWGVPMLPNTPGVSLAAGAAGQYNGYFSQLAYALVNHGQANSVIMLGWDPEDGTLPWAASTPSAAAQYVAYWRQIVTAMRSVPDEQFQFAWDAAPESDPVLPPALYPGNAYVDVVATDAFDKSSGTGVTATGWSALAESPYGPDWFATFAAHHRKPLMIAKWGVVPTTASGGGDNPAYVSQFLRWADQKHLFAAVTWDYGAWAVTGGDFPRSATTLHTVAEAGAVTPIVKVVPA